MDIDYSVRITVVAMLGFDEDQDQELDRVEFTPALVDCAKTFKVEIPSS